MDNLPSLHQRALESTGRFLARVEDDAWHSPTPCDPWDVRTLANHIVSGNWWVHELGSGHTIEEVGSRLDGDLLGDDPVIAYEKSAAAAAAAFSGPDAMAAMFAVSYGPVPGKVYARHRFIDVLVHGWDIAAATGQDDLLDPDLVQACWAMVEARPQMRSQWGFAPIEIPAAGDLQTRLLAFVGRPAPWRGP
jgi:uncharacterized protein (TIGR03086 family)